MNDKIRLYIGLVVNGEWYNYVKIEELQGGMIAMLDTADKTATGRLRGLVEQTVKYLYTDPEAGEEKELEMQNSHYNDFKLDDAWKVALEIQKQFSGEEYPEFEEFFFCPVCSTQGRERYTKVKESWAKMIENGLIDEVYCDSPDCSEVVNLEHGIVIKDNKLVTHGKFSVFIVEPITISELQKITKNDFIVDNEALLLCAIWDTKIKAIEGLTSKDLNILKRSIKDPFTKKYLLNKDDVEIMTNVTSYGMDADFRSVSCRYCHNEIGGGLDFTNFFEFAFPSRSNRGLSQSKIV